VSEEGKLRAVGCDSRWLLEARLADDCHSYNVLLQRGGDGNTLVLYVVKSIRNGEELQLWFSEQMLVLLAVPFLTPLNIQGITKLNFLTNAWISGFPREVAENCALLGCYAASTTRRVITQASAVPYQCLRE